MKLASYNDGSRDGRLLVVSKNLKYFVNVDDVAPTMQFAIDNWNNVSIKLKKIYEKLNANTIHRKPFDEQLVHSPLPRAFQWLDASAYVNHVSLVRKARNAEMPESFWTDPLMYQGGSDDFIPPRSPIVLSDENWGIDFEAEIAIIINDVDMGSSSDKVEDKILLIMLANDVSLRNLVPNEISKGFGFIHSKPSTAFSPVAVTLDEIKPFWKNGKLLRTINTTLNDKAIGKVDADKDMTFNFYELIAHASKSRNLRAGTIIGSGTISNRSDDGGPGKTINMGGRGYSCIAELRMVEEIKTGSPKTPFMKFGDKVSISVFDDNKNSIFGTIEQTLIKK